LTDVPAVRALGRHRRGDEAKGERADSSSEDNWSDRSVHVGAFIHQAVGSAQEGLSYQSFSAGFSIGSFVVEFTLMKHHARTAVLGAIVCLILGAVWPAPGRAQSPAAAAAEGTLIVAGDVTQALTITSADLKGMPRTTVTMSEEGKQITYEGVLVGELLKRAGAPVGGDLTGKAVATYVRASAKDGYQVVFSLAELDPGFTPNDIIVADTLDGKPLFDYQGPFRIVAPHDKRGARSIRMLQRIEVVRLLK
jgi:hypothetical protein